MNEVNMSADERARIVREKHSEEAAVIEQELHEWAARLRWSIRWFHARGTRYGKSGISAYHRAGIERNGVRTTAWFNGRWESNSVFSNERRRELYAQAKARKQAEQQS